MPYNKMYPERLSVCIAKEHKEMLIKLSKKQNKTINAIIREAIVYIFNKT